MPASKVKSSSGLPGKDALRALALSPSADKARARAAKQADEMRKANPAAAKSAGLPTGRAAKMVAPKTLGAAADRLWEVRAKRLSFNGTIDECKAEEAFLKDHLIDSLPKSDANGVAGKLCRVSITKKEVPQVENWSALYRHVVAEYQRHVKAKDGMEDAAFAYLNRALNAAAVEEQWEAKKAVPGVRSFTAVGVSINKV